ncbi:MAG: proton-conducting transporter membrane subunit [Thermoanaerobaculales bacterium]|jgi:formate hydrogenlyase subunit 3/multisubunit Na+/H+ antiporter MnhD subunit|nr:proton-conducting transporter membrane subunit [Thermoanaerobaculales bacterium]
MTGDRLLVLVPIVPLLAAVAAFAVPRWSRRIALWSMALTATIVVWIADEILRVGDLTHPLAGWSAPLGIDLRVDGLAVVMLLAVAGVGLIVSFNAASSFHETGSRGVPERVYWPLWLFLFSALNAIFVAGDVFTLYVAFEINGLAAVSLVAIAGKPEALGAALRYLFVSLTGSLLYLMGVAVLYADTGVLDLMLLADRITPGPPAIAACVLMTGGLMMKAALFPLHFWLPPAHSSAPAPVSAVLSALVVKGGFVILLRLWFGPFAEIVDGPAVQWIGALGAAAVLWGSFQALFQDRLKLVVAYSTVAQLGYLFLIVPIAWSAETRSAALAGGITLLLSHATAKAAFFLAAGNVLTAIGNDRAESLCGLSRWLPVSAFAMGLAAVSLVGLPPSAGFVGKWMLIVAAMEQRQWWWVAVMLIGTVLAAAYVVRILGPAFLMPESDPQPGPVPRLMEWTAFSLAAASVVLGLAASGVARFVNGSLPSGVGP